MSRCANVSSIWTLVKTPVIGLADADYIGYGLQVANIIRLLF